MSGYTELKECRVCGNENLVEVLDLKNQPLANSYHNGSNEQETYPVKHSMPILKILFCYVNNIAAAEELCWTSLATMVHNYTSSKIGDGKPMVLTQPRTFTS